MRKVNKAAKIRELLAAGKSIDEVAASLKSIGVTPAYVRSIKWNSDMLETRKLQVPEEVVKDSPSPETVSNKPNDPNDPDDQVEGAVAVVKSSLLHGEYIGWLRGNALFHLVNSTKSGKFSSDIYKAALYLTVLLEYLTDLDGELASKVE